MNLKTGIDLVEIERIRAAVERHGERFLSRIFTTQERTQTREVIASLAARFAAKEAVAKALGTGIGDIRWNDIEILRGENREPLLHLHGEAQRIAHQQSLTNWSVSLSHTREYAVAMVTGFGLT